VENQPRMRFVVAILPVDSHRGLPEVLQRKKENPPAFGAVGLD
jgi:hypothetical protein